MTLSPVIKELKEDFDHMYSASPVYQTGST